MFRNRGSLCCLGVLGMASPMVFRNRTLPFGSVSPPNWTLIPYRNKPAEQCPDGPRYKACGNSMAVPVMAYLGRRIQMVEDILKQQNDVAATIPQL